MIPATKLVRKITEALAQNLDRAALEGPAAEYAKLCRAANRRLEQCAAMLEKGNDKEAIELAEAPPPLFDLVAALSFDGSEEWQRTCRENGLTVPDTLDEHSFRSLQDLYSRGISPSHPLYKEYRTAIAERDDVRALAALQAVLRFNPNDTTAQTEWVRVEDKLRARFVELMSDIASRRDTARAIGLLERMENIVWERPPAGPAVDACDELRRQHQAQQALAECEKLLAQLRQVVQEQKWEPGQPLVQRIELLNAQFNVRFEGKEATEFADLRVWVERHRSAHEARMRQREALQQLQFLVDSGEAHEAGRGWGNLKAVRSELRELQSAWHELEEFGLAVPAELQMRYQRRCGVLTGETGRLLKLRYLTIAVSTAMLLALASLTGFLLIRWLSASDAAAQLRQLEKGRLVFVAEKQLQQLKQQAPALMSWSVLADQARRTQEWIQREQGLNGLWLGSLTQLQALATNSFSGPTLQALMRQRTQAEQQYQALAPDYKAKSEVPWLQLVNALEEFLKSQQDRVGEELQRIVTRGETAAGRLDFSDPSRTLAQLRQVVQEVAHAVGDWDGFVGSLASPLTVDDQWKTRAQEIKTKLTNVKKELDALDRATSDLRSARNIGEYLQALDHYGTGALELLTEIRNARVSLKARQTLTNFVARVLMPHDPTGWGQFLRNPNAEFFPTDVTPPERTKFLTLRDDENLRSIYRYELYSDSSAAPRHAYCQGQAQEKSKRSVTTKSGEVKTPSRYSGMFFTPVIGAALDRPVFSAQLLECGVEGKLTPESDLFVRCGAVQLANSTAQKFTRPLLEVLDTVRTNKQASVLFRAYLHAKLCELLEVRPLEWGAHWVPGVTNDYRRLLREGGTDLQSGDWMLPDKIAEREQKLETWYAGISKTPYLARARFLKSLIGQMHAAIGYAGFVGNDGTPVLLPGTKLGGELWGLEKSTLQLALLFRADPKASAGSPARPAQPMSPLFWLPGDKRAVLQAAAQAARVSVDDPAVQAQLPPCFH